VVERGGLENRCPFGDRGFESLTLCNAQSLAQSAGLSYLEKARRSQGPDINVKANLCAAKEALCVDDFPNGISEVNPSLSAMKQNRPAVRRFFLFLSGKVWLEGGFKENKQPKNP
jgi:hypothetical protein